MTDIILCRTGSNPEVYKVTNPEEELLDLIGSFDLIPYPVYLRKGKGQSLRMAVCDAGLSDNPHNRWGIHGDFAVVSWPGNRKAPASLSPETAERVIADLNEEYGAMDDRADTGVIYAQQIGASLTSAESFVSRGGSWEPDLHWTGTHEQPEIKFVNWLLLRYTPNIEAVHISSPFGVGYSVEVQFGRSPADREKRAECRAIYAESFDDDGSMRPEVIARPPRPWQPVRS